MAVILFVVRHAPVSVTGLCYGQTDVPTAMTASDAAGHLRSALDAPASGPPAVTGVISSPMRRTADVARILAPHLGVPLEIDARISELAMGAWEGRPYEAIEREDPVRFARWMEAWRTEAPPGGETVDQLTARVRNWLHELQVAPGRESGPNAPVPVRIVVTHAGVIRTLRALHRRVDVRDLMGEPVPHLRPERYDF